MLKKLPLIILSVTLLNSCAIVKTLISLPLGIAKATGTSVGNIPGVSFLTDETSARLPEENLHDTEGETSLR